MTRRRYVALGLHALQHRGPGSGRRSVSYGAPEPEKVKEPTPPEFNTVRRIGHVSATISRKSIE